MSPGLTFERVYLALKEQIGSGRHGANAHLDPSALSADLNASITPVRDALHRLVGEGLVEAPRGDGFRTPLVTEISLRHLYRWNGCLLDLAARTRRAPAIETPDTHFLIHDRHDPLARIESLFLGIARLSANPEHVAAVARLGERLRPMRRVEAALVPDGDAELAGLDAALAAGAPPLRRALAGYHRRRERLAAEIVEALHRRSEERGSFPA